VFYGVNKWFSTITLFSSIQWIFFIFANTVVVPISIGAAFGLSTETIAMMLRSSLIFTGAACILQCWFGHRYPLMEGHSGLYWGVMLNLALSASSLGMSYTEIGGGIATGIFISGLITVLIVLFNLVGFVQKIFTPMVTTVYLFLLTFQLVFIFFKGMFKLTEDGAMDVPPSLLSIGIVVLVSWLKIRGNQLVSNFSILIGIVVGWGLYALLFPDAHASTGSSGLSFQLFPLGKPNLKWGIIAVTVFAGLMNLSNTIAAVHAAASLYKEQAEHKQFLRSFFVTGIFSFIASLFGLVPYTPFTSSIGFLQSTRILQKEPFFLGGGLMILIGMIPPLGDFLSAMPITIGNAVLFVAYLQLFGTAYNSLNGTLFTSFTIFRLAGPVLIGESLMNSSPKMFSSLPVLLQPFLANGLIMGVLISIFLEKMMNWKKLSHMQEIESEN
jgi:xanthine/uracil permease